MIEPNAATVFRLYDIDGVPSTGVYEPDKTLIINWGTRVEEMAEGVAGDVDQTSSTLVSEVIQSSLKGKFVQVNATNATRSLPLHPDGWSTTIINLNATKLVITPTAPATNINGRLTAVLQQFDIVTLVSNGIDTYRAHWSPAGMMNGANFNKQDGVYAALWLNENTTPVANDFSNYALILTGGIVKLNAPDSSGTLKLTVAGSIDGLTIQGAVGAVASAVFGGGAIATTATDGFLYLVSCAGVPTGTPTAKTGRVPIIIDSSNNTLRFYSSGAWQSLSGGGGGSGTVTTVSVASANGFSGSVANPTTTPVITLTMTGMKLPYVAKTATYSIVAATDYFIDCTSGTFTVTFPTAVGIQGQVFVVKNSGTGVITLAGTSAQTFDGSASPTLAVQNTALSFISNNANWKVF